MSIDAAAPANSANTGSFTKWFALVYDRMRTISSSSSETIIWARDDVAVVGQLLQTLQATMSKEHRRDLANHLAQCNDESVPPANAPSRATTLSLVDVMDLIEQFGETYDGASAAPSTESLSMKAQWRAHVAEDATRADLRLMLSLLALSDTGLSLLRSRLPVVFSPPTSPRAASPKTATTAFSSHVPESSVVAAKRMRPVDDEGPSRPSPVHSSPRLLAAPTASVPGNFGRADASAATPPGSPKPVQAAPACALTTGSPKTLDALLWRPPATQSAVCDKILRGGPTSSTQGSDAPPGRPFDPEYPQRVMESTPEKLVRRMCKAVPAEQQGAAAGCDVGFFADTKYDGERLIGFRTDVSEPFVFYSRNMLPVPARKLSGVPELLTAAFGPIARVVFDAEILSLSTFGSMNEVHKSEIAMSGPRVFVFDLLWYNGHSLTALPLFQRKEILYHVLTQSRNVQMSKMYWLSAGAPTGSSGGSKVMEHQLMMVFEDAMTKRLEGFVLKPGASSYRFNGTDWVKLKKGYMVGDEKPGGAGAQLPGGLVTAMRIRRIDGVPVTALSVAASSAAAAEGKDGAPLSSPAAATANRSSLFCKLNDGIDALVVARCTAADRRSTVLCALRDDDHDKDGNMMKKSTAQTDRFVTCGFARCPSELEDAVLHRVSACDSRPPMWLAPPLDAEGSGWAWFRSASECPVVEVHAGGLVNDSQHTCDGVAVTSDARIVRLRDDKDAKCVNTRSQLRVMYSFAMPVFPRPVNIGGASASARDETALRTAVRKLNEQHWEPLPHAASAADTAVFGVSESGECKRWVEVDRRGATAVTAVLKDSAFDSDRQPPNLYVLLINVAAGKRWSERGVMGEVTTKLGQLVGQASDAFLAKPTACSGDLVAALLPERPGVLCVVAALIRLVPTETATTAALVANLEGSTVLDVVLVRLLGMVCSVASGYGVVRVHTDVTREDDVARWSTAVSKLVKELPSHHREKLTFVLHIR